MAKRKLQVGLGRRGPDRKWIGRWWERGWRSCPVPKKADDLRSPEGGCGLATGEKASWALGRRRATGEKSSEVERERDSKRVPTRRPPGLVG